MKKPLIKKGIFTLAACSIALLATAACNGDTGSSTHLPLLPPILIKKHLRLEQDQHTTSKSGRDQCNRSTGCIENWQ